MDEPIIAEVAPGDPEEKREIKDVAFLDLTGVKSADSLKNVTKISDVACLVYPESLADAVMKIPMEDVACLVPVPDGANVRMQTGQLTVAGESLANAGGSPDDILALIGQICITPPVDKVGLKLILAGQVFCPKGSQGLIGGAAIRMTGQISYYTGKPRFTNGSETFEKAFFEFLDEPVAMIINGEATIEADVSLDLLKSKVESIIVNGRLKAPKALLPAIKALAAEINGEVKALEDE
jgi:hypothetical protein